MDNNTINPNDTHLDNPNPPIPTIWNQRYFKLLIASNVISMPSLFIFMTSGQLLLDGKGGYIVLPIMLISGFLTMIFGNIFPISTIYTFFKTIKKKDFISHAHNIFCRYIIAACLISAIYLFLVYKVFNLYLYLKTNNLEIVNFIPFISINIAGFIHITILDNRYKKSSTKPTWHYAIIYLWKSFFQN